MESGGSSSQCGKKNGKKAKKTNRVRRAWSPMEEQVLADLMKELVANGWRSGNGFKPGYLGRLEAGMAERLPGTTIRYNPHIISRISIWKKCHGALLAMLKENSGIGFNTTTGVIDCHNTAWDLICKADPNAINMRYKAWPLFEDWNEIFGKDKATGDNAEDVAEAVDGLKNDDVGTDSHANVETDDADLDEELPQSDFEVNSEVPPIQRPPPPPLSKNKGKKRELEQTPTDKICETMYEMNRSSDVRMDNLVRVLGYDSSLGAERRELFNVIEGLTGITEEAKVDAAHILASKKECLELFLGMKPEQRVAYVGRLLSGKLVI